MKKLSIVHILIGLAAAAVFFAAAFFLFCPALNVRSPGIWLLAAVTAFVGILVTRLCAGKKDFGRVTITKKVGSKKPPKKITKFRFAWLPYILPLGIVVFTGLMLLVGCEELNATRYAAILQVKESDFASDLAETVGTDSIALMDTASATRLGDREIGALSDLVSQFDVSSDYTQIDYKGRPVKVSALQYAGFFKWLSNKENGVPGYVTVDPVSMSASFCKTEGMKYVPSACFFQDAYRCLRMRFPTLMFENLHFEIDENGKPYYLASVVKKTVGLFGGKTVDGCVALDPGTGEAVYYAADAVPLWMDVVYSGDLICRQYNWYGMLRNGYLNSMFAKKGCQRVTTYAPEGEDDDHYKADYGYVAKEGDIWIYTGVTSVNGDSSNIGFLLANERTGEARYYAISGADEHSAMTAAEGEVQEKGYRASFPSLINVEGEPTYIMVLKDSGGLVKLYAAVNVAQYNLVATAATQKACIEKYKTLLDLGDPGPEAQEETAVITVSDVKYIDIDGNTYVYLLTADGSLYKAKAAENEALLFVAPGDTLRLTHAGTAIVSFEPLENSNE